MIWASRKERDKLDRARLDHLLATIATSGGRIIIPTPALAVFLVGVDEAAAEWLNTLDKKRSVFVAPFDRRCAFECSLLDKAAMGIGDKRSGRKEPWQRIKVDRQIVAVAKVNQATILVTNDDGLRATATDAAITVHRVHELDVPDSARQQGLPFDPANAQTAASRA